MVGNIAVMFPGFLPYRDAFELDIEELRRWDQQAQARSPKRGGK